MEIFNPANILIFGATGQIGRHITAAILAADPPFVSVTAFTSPSTAASKADLLMPWTANGLKVIQGDVRYEADVLKGYEGVDTVISCLGRNVLMHQLELLRWASQSGSVKWFFPSEYGTDIEYCDKSKDEKPHQMKLAVRKFVAEEVKNVKVTYLVTGPYADMFFYLKDSIQEAGGFDARRRKAVVIGDSKSVGFTTMRDVGKGVVAAVRHPEACPDKKPIKIQSFVVGPREILAAFQDQAPGEWKDVRYSTLDRVRDLERRLWEEGSPDATLVTLRRIWAEGGTLYERTDNEVIGLKAEDLESLADVVGRAVRKAQEGCATVP